MMRERFLNRKTQISRLVTLARLAVPHFQMLETQSMQISKAMDGEPRAWGYWNSTPKQEEYYFSRVLPGGFTPLIQQTRDNHRTQNGQIVCITFGSNNSALDGLLSEHDVQIAVALQDFRGKEEIDHDTKRGFYLVTGTIGDPSVWRNVRGLLKALHQEEKIHDPSANIVIGSMKGGWETLPLDTSSMLHLADELGIIHEPIDQETFSLYRELILSHMLGITSPSASIITDAPGYLHEALLQLQPRLTSSRRTRMIYVGDAIIRGRIRIDRMHDSMRQTSADTLTSFGETNASQ